MAPSESTIVRGICVSTTKRITDGRANTAHHVLADMSDGAGERRLRDRVEIIAIDNGSPVDSDFHVVDVNFCSETTDRRSDLGHRNEISNIENF